MRPSAWITILYICTLFSLSKGIVVLYGSQHILYCSVSDSDTLPGDWFRNGAPLNMYSKSIRIPYATFWHSGQYQCRRNGTNVFPQPFRIIVYGQLQISPLNCTSMSYGVCVKHVKRGQRVTLCTSRTTIPSTIPPGRNVLDVSGAIWKLIDQNGALTNLYTRSSAGDFYGAHPSSFSHSTHYSDVTESCLTINSVQGISTYILRTYLHESDVLTDTFNPDVYFYVTYGGIPQLYGSEQTLWCGESGPITQPGDWFHDGVPLGVYSKSYTITNATFIDDGEYQCRKNGTNVFTSPLQVDVYGLLNITPLNCDSISHDHCVKYVKRGQPVTLCTTLTSTPSQIPQRKHVISVTRSHWFVVDEKGGQIPLYTCFNGSCIQNSSNLNYTRYSAVKDSCLTIDDVQENKRYVFSANFHPTFVKEVTIVFQVTHEDFKVLYGMEQTLYCGDSVPGEWYHNGKKLGVYSRSYTIANANFDDDGEYRCYSRKNGKNALPSPFKVYVYGLINLTPLNCNSMSGGVCVKHVERGQPVTLCTKHTTTPSTIPQGKHVISASYSYWQLYVPGRVSFPILYNCSNGSCDQTHSIMNNEQYSDVTASCLTIDNVQKYSEYILAVYFNVDDARAQVNFSVTYGGISVLYGSKHALHCGDSDPDATPGDWYHDSIPLGAYGWNYTITSATFSDDGEYQCRKKGRNVFRYPLQVYVYGLINMIPVNCNSISEGSCVKHVKRGQPVTLCTSHTTTPSTIPQGKHVIGVSNSSWLVIYGGDLIPLYTCSSSSCKPLSNSSDVNYARYSMATANCLTVSDVQEEEVYVLKVHFYPVAPSVTNVSFNIKYSDPDALPQPNGTTDNPIVIAVSTSIVTIAIVIMIIISTVVVSVVVKRYKRSRYTALSSVSYVSLREDSSPQNLTVYREKDVKKLEKIGRGSFWKVYSGKLSDTRCAIKKLRGMKKSGNLESLIQKVMIELDTWSSLNHPNILRLYGIYHEDEGDGIIPSLIVELMDQSLTDHLNATSDPTKRMSLFPLKTKISILSQVAGALEYLHSHKSVVHGDLTANNVLLKENTAEFTDIFTAKITDFGMSRVLNEQDNIMSSVQGTYSYMPPEVHNDGETSTKVDIYSFGVLCVHILSHRFPKPLHALRVDQAGAHIVVSEFNRFRPYLLELTEDERLLEPLVEECLQYNPEVRLHPDEVIGQLDSVQRRLSLVEKRRSNSSQTRHIVHQHFIGPVVSGCTITESNLNVQSITDCNMKVSAVAEITPLKCPVETIPQ